MNQEPLIIDSLIDNSIIYHSYQELITRLMSQSHRQSPTSITIPKYAKEKMPKQCGFIIVWDYFAGHVSWGDVVGGWDIYFSKMVPVKLSTGTVIAAKVSSSVAPPSASTRWMLNWSSSCFAMTFASSVCSRCFWLSTSVNMSSPRRPVSPSTQATIE